MIDNVEDLGLREGLKDLKGDEFFNKLDAILTEKLGLGLEGLVMPLSQYVIDHAEELALTLPNIVPFDNYEKILENNDDMSAFLKTEAAQSKNWAIESISNDDKFENLIRFVFQNIAVDEAETLRGTVFVSKTGVIRHAYAQTIV